MPILLHTAATCACDYRTFVDLCKYNTHSQTLESERVVVVVVLYFAWTHLVTDGARSSLLRLTYTMGFQLVSPDHDLFDYQCTWFILLTKLSL